MVLFSLAGCSEALPEVRTLNVQASAYNSVAAQTNAQPSLAAWGDTLKPGMKAVAVSRDLIKAGLTHNTLIEIEGLPGQYRVLDKMHKRWTQKIDIYMGEDIAAAREWGVREVEIRWVPAAAD
ncbi:3D domain-containing protein [Marinobacterium maritimum]|uniref:3D domain-containing protein n=1 Tax=Marinobacterium maritimum TaxID=500162 RepID=A0ABN1I8P9_9GAMM